MPRAKKGPPTDALYIDDKALREAMQELIETGEVLQYYPAWPHISLWPRLFIHAFPNDPKTYKILDAKLKKLGWRRGKRTYSDVSPSRFVKDGVREETWNVVLKKAIEPTDE